MSEPGLKLTIYFSERDRAGGGFLADALFDVYERHRLRTSVLLRGASGFGARHRVHSDRVLTLSETLPVVSVAVDSREAIELALPEVLEVTEHGLVSLERATLHHGVELERFELGFAPSDPLKLTFYGGRSVRTRGQAGYVTAIELLHRTGIAGASALLGVDGTLHGERRRARFLARNAAVPLMVLAIGAHSQLAPVVGEIARLLDDPVLTVEQVQVRRSDGAGHESLEAVDERDHSGLPVWQKVMVHVEEQATFQGHPVHLELVRQLAAAGASGVTVLRGVRGFYAGRELVADEVLALRRNVPVHVVAVDTPAAVKGWWPVVEQLTAQTGIVTTELVPAVHAPGADDGRGLKLARTRTGERHER